MKSKLTKYQKREALMKHVTEFKNEFGVSETKLMLGLVVDNMQTQEEEAAEDARFEAFLADERNWYHFKDKMGEV